MVQILPSLAQQINEATQAVFGNSPLTESVHEACQKYASDLNNIQAGRGINALLIAVVGAKGQGKTWAIRQFIKDDHVRAKLRSGDLSDDATTRLVWVGPAAPDGMEPDSEFYHPCSVEQMVHLGQSYVLLDTPGLTDADHRAAKLAEQALSLAPIKLLVMARDQLRNAANMTIAKQIDGALCVPIISSVEPEEMPGGEMATQLAADLRALRQQLELMAPRSEILEDLLVPDFEVSGDEQAAGQVLIGGVLDRLNDLGLTSQRLVNARQHRIKAAEERLFAEVGKTIGDKLPQLSLAVEQLHHETELLPQRVLQSLLGSETVLATGVRMRLRTRLISDTPLLWFPYRTLMSTLNLTQGAWDRVALAMAGSVPSLFGALASWARNAKQSRDFEGEVQDGIRRRTQQQVEERLRPLCERFHRALLKLSPRAERGTRDELASSGVRLAGVEELQTRSQQIFDAAIAEHATGFWLVQSLAIGGTLLFWSFMAGPIVLLYREYIWASLNVLAGQGDMTFDDFPHPTAGLLLTSVLLSLLPLAIYCMVVLTFALSRRKVDRVASEIIRQHDETIDELKRNQVITLEFDDPLLYQAEFLLSLKRSNSGKGVRTRQF